MLSFEVLEFEGIGVLSSIFFIFDSTIVLAGMEMFFVLFKVLKLEKNWKIVEIWDNKQR